MSLHILKAPNEIPAFDDPRIHYGRGVVASTKLDGNRGICIDGCLYTSSMKTPRNVHLQAMLMEMQRMSALEDKVFDYEIWSPSCTHHAEIAGWINSYDQLPPYRDVAAYVFDVMPTLNYYGECRECPYGLRLEKYVNRISEGRLGPHVIPLPQTMVYNAEELRGLFQARIAEGSEGLIVRHTAIWREGGKVRGGWYKHGRATLNDCIIYKFKHFETLDGVILEVIQRRMLRPDWPRTYNADGSLHRPLEKAAYMMADMVGAFRMRVVLPGSETEVITEVAFGPGFDHAWRAEMWKIAPTLVGRYAEVEYMPHGGLAGVGGALRIGRFIRFREDLDNV